MGIISSLALLCAALTMTGCNTAAPIMNVSNTAVIGPMGRPLSADEVRAAIIRAGASLGWVVTDARPGVLNGRLLLRTHTADVEIPYTPTAYSITYKSSINLNESGGQIHRNYNGWIQNLTRNIDAQLAAS
jgi:hypothetical protein